MLADNTINNNSYVTSLSFPAPDIKYWEFLCDNFYIRLYNGSNWIYPGIDVEGEFTMNLNAWKHNLNYKCTLISWA